MVTRPKHGLTAYLRAESGYRRLRPPASATRPVARRSAVEGSGMTAIQGPNTNDRPHVSQNSH